MRRHLLILLAIFALVLIAYQGVWGFGFIYDDYAHLVDNEAVHSLTPVTKFFTNSGIFTDGVVLSVWRPLATFTSGLSWYLFGANPAGYHLLNLTLHLLNVTLVYFISLSIFNYKIAAPTVTAIFALHPIGTEAVTWISSQNTLLCSLFFLLSFLFLIKKKVTFSAVFFGLSLLTKEIAIVGPVVILAGLYLSNDSKGAKNFQDILRGLAPFLIIEASYFLIRSIFAPSPEGLWGSLSMIPVVIYTYVKIFFWPINIFTLDAIPRADFFPVGMWDSRLILGLSLIISFSILTAYFFKRKWHAEFFGLVWFTAFLLPVIQIIPTPGVLGSRVLYLPLIGLAITLVSLVMRIPKFPYFKEIAKVLTALLLVILTILTFQNNKKWRDSKTFWLGFIKQFPQSDVASRNLSAYYTRENGYGSLPGKEQSKELLNLWSVSPFLRILSGQALPGDYDMTERRFLEILSRNPKDEVTIRNLQILRQIGDPEKISLPAK